MCYNSLINSLYVTSPSVYEQNLLISVPVMHLDLPLWTDVALISSTHTKLYISAAAYFISFFNLIYIQYRPDVNT